jgi:hypothetical protein
LVATERREVFSLSQGLKETADVGEQRRPTYLLPVELAPYGSFGVRFVVDVNVVVAGTLP